MYSERLLEHGLAILISSIITQDITTSYDGTHHSEGLVDPNGQKCAQKNNGY
jgi:hypothetical protein